MEDFLIIMLIYKNINFFQESFDLISKKKIGFYHYNNKAISISGFFNNSEYFEQNFKNLLIKFSTNTPVSNFLEKIIPLYFNGKNFQMMKQNLIVILKIKI
jgi:hypothetical protein